MSHELAREHLEEKRSIPFARIGAGLGLALMGAFGLVLGGFPRWAARRLLYPVAAEAAYAGVDLPLEWDDLPAERVEFTNSSGQRLSGWFVPGQEVGDVAAPWPAILLVHGYGGYKEQMASYARLVRRAGFACFMFDTQGSGLLRGLPLTLGWRERDDIAAATRYLQSRPDVDPERIGALGISMGAAAVLLAAEQEPAIKAVVSDSSYADLTSMIKPGLSAFLGPMSVPFAPLIIRQAESLVGASVAAIVPEHSATALGDRPLLIIHGEDDTLIAAESAVRIYDAAAEPKELWLVPECLHAEAPTVQAAEYEKRVNAFFTKWLVRPSGNTLTGAA